MDCILVDLVSFIFNLDKLGKFEKEIKALKVGGMREKVSYSTSSSKLQPEIYIFFLVLYRPRVQPSLQVIYISEEVED